MIGDPRVTEALNEVLSNELTAINQYYLHYAMQKNWGYDKLAEHTYHESIDEMKHADVLIHRLLFLEGHPNLQRLHPLRIGETVKEQLEADDLPDAVYVEGSLDGGGTGSTVFIEDDVAADALTPESDRDLRRGIDICTETKDTVTRLLFERILESEEEHVDYLETQLSLLAALGDQHYLAHHMRPPADPTG